MTGAGKRAVFLDRDGTLVDELGFLRRPEDLRLLPGAAEGLRLLNEAGWLAVLVTNQSGIARGYFDEADLRAVHERLTRELARGGAHLDAMFHCPHHPEVGAPPLRGPCACRKPAPGLLLEARERMGLDLGRSWMIGDSLRDLEAGRRAGLEGEILVLTGKGAEERAGLPPGARTAPDLLAAARWLVTWAAAPREAQGR